MAEIDIGVFGGAGCIGGGTRTFIQKANPANATGKITLIVYGCWSAGVSGVKVGTFYLTNENTLKCRDSEAVAGASDYGTFEREVDLDVAEGDFIGVSYSGCIYCATTGGDGLWYKAGDFCNPGDETEYTLYAEGIKRLNGTGESETAAQPYSFIM
jgi:hypothetical protein